MSIRSFAADLLPAKLHGLARAPAAVAQQAEVTTFAELSEKLGYLSKSDLKKVREAYKFADQAHLAGPGGPGRRTCRPRAPSSGRPC